MNINDKHAILLGRHEAWLEYAIEGLKGETYLQGPDLAAYLEERIRQTNEEVLYLLKLTTMNINEQSI